MDYVVKYVAPTRLDTADFGTIHKVMGDNDTSELWIQTSTDITNPQWLKVSFILEKVFAHRPEVISECLNIYLKQGSLELYELPLNLIKSLE